jgi:hypothetical protein
MALPASGVISMDDIRSEFVGGSAELSLQDLYRGSAGGNSIIRQPAANNSATDLASSVPTSGPISFSDFYSTERTYQKTYSSNDSGIFATSIFGDDYSTDYRKRFVIDSGVTITDATPTGNAFTFETGADGQLQITNNGAINVAGGYCIDNESSITVSVTNNGSVSATDRDYFISPFVSGGSAQMDFVGGMGGASGPDIYHSDYGGGFNCKLTRSGNTFTASWTYNELDYTNIGPGDYNVSSIFPLDGNGFLDYTDTSEYVINANAGSFGRDTRDIAFGSKIIDGVRHFWFAANNKSSTMTLSSTMTYQQSGWTAVALSTTNSRRSAICSLATGATTFGSVTGV